MKLPHIRQLLPVFLFVLFGCSEHKVDTFPRWCEQLSGVDLQKKYAPFWAVSGVSFHGDAIRDGSTL